MRVPHSGKYLFSWLLAAVLTSAACSEVRAQAPLDFAIIQIRNSLGSVRSGDGVVPVDALRALLIANFYANNFDGDPAITVQDQLNARRLPNAAERAERLAEFHRADLDGDGTVTGPEMQALGANSFWRKNPDGSRPSPSGMTGGILSDIIDGFDVEYPLDRATLLSPDWIRVATLSVPPGLDPDGDGRVSPQEYAATLDMALRLADLDRDGRLSEGEVVAVAVRATASDALVAAAPLAKRFWIVPAVQE